MGLIDPIKLETFFSEYWEKQYLHISRNNESLYQEIITFQDINEYLSRADIRYPNIRLVQNGSEIPLSQYSQAYTYGTNLFQGHIDIDKVFALYNSGATISFQLLQHCIPKLSRFSNQLERELHFPTQTNLFLTPPGSQGFTAHYDTHSFFVFHIYGTKRWRLYDRPVRFPLLKERIYDDEAWEQREPTEELLLKPGDFLYVPRGVYHEADTSDSTALQITMGIFPLLWTDILRSALLQMEEDVIFRQSPLAAIGRENNIPQLQEDFRLLLERMHCNFDMIRALNEFKSKVLSNETQHNINRLTDSENAAHLSEDTKVYTRDINLQVITTDDSVLLRVYDKEIALPRFLEKSVWWVVSQREAFCVGDIKDQISSDMKCALCRKLLEEGVLTVRSDNKIL